VESRYFLRSGAGGLLRIALNCSNRSAKECSAVERGIESRSCSRLERRMGMLAIVRRLPDADVARLLSDPNLIDDYVGSEEAPEGFSPFAELDLDKSWHGIHFLLTGSAWEGEVPLNFLVSGGTPVGEVDLGYGPARALSSADVRVLNSALEALLPAELHSRFAPEAMMAADIYPAIWDRPLAEDDTRDYVVSYYESLREFVSETASAGEALLVFMS
jgi:Domain of unknown function (DUF1877)